MLGDFYLSNMIYTLMIIVGFVLCWVHYPSIYFALVLVIPGFLGIMINEIRDS